MDGLPVRSGREYRLSPGQHELVVQVVEKTSETFRPYHAGVGSGGVHSGPVDGSANINVSETGQLTATGGNPFGGAQMANLTVAGRRISYFTNTLSVETGWRYDFDGYEVKKIRWAK